ncbi:hypothetical protein EYF80_027399 [Liparis tanakae]|uniref:Uncharacterized protein n=1 Tax=Liparis tanakae TaxID=230148 RepID=A0A4Z2H930_9TELE|nr:hypothetical protein EYF80_027399 [Liparis tanakae]
MAAGAPVRPMGPSGEEQTVVSFHWKHMSSGVAVECSPSRGTALQDKHYGCRLRMRTSISPKQKYPVKKMKSVDVSYSFSKSYSSHGWAHFWACSIFSGVSARSKRMPWTLYLGRSQRLDHGFGRILTFIW